MARIDCSTNTVDFVHRKTSYCISPKAQDYAKEISVNAFTKDLRSGSMLFAVCLRPSDDEHKNIKNTLYISKNLEKYKDVFPTEPQKGLPPSRI